MGGWIAACGILAGLYARRARGQGQSVRSSLLAAGITLKSGAFAAGGTIFGGPSLDASQLGYGAVYRIYRGADDRWFALAVPDQTGWQALRAIIGERPASDLGSESVWLPESAPPLRAEGGDPQPEEKVLEQVFRQHPASYWVTRLSAAGVPVEPVAEVDREGFVSGFVDDPVNRQLGRVVSYQWGERGRVEQTCFPPRFGPAGRTPAAGIAGLGQHTAEVLEEVGFDAEERAKLAAGGAIPA
jgi:crotonobetainyl-CoA:carnitine CoA-transferase CaiB-like acyl-CoA transferase